MLLHLAPDVIERWCGRPHALLLLQLLGGLGQDNELVIIIAVSIKCLWHMPSA